MKTLVYEYDGYAVGDRLLEGVVFQVITEVTNDSIRLISIAPRADMMQYVSNIKWENFEPAMRADINSKIENYLSVLPKNTTVLEDFAIFSQETGLPGIQILNEV